MRDITEGSKGCSTLSENPLRLIEARFGVRELAPALNTAAHRTGNADRNRPRRVAPKACGKRWQATALIKTFRKAPNQMQRPVKPPGDGGA